jgi:hypothetical protein
MHANDMHDLRINALFGNTHEQMKSFPEATRVGKIPSRKRWKIT